MKTLYRLLKTAFWGFLGAYLGLCLYRYADFARRPGLYAMQSAPWYAGLLPAGLLTAGILLAFALGMRLIKRRWK